MARKFTEKKLVIASHNEGKVREIRELLSSYDIEVISGAEFNLPEPEETGKTFLENAAIKSDFFAKETNLPSLADDSGLVVPALGGAPGIFSARWAGEKRDFSVAIEKVKEELTNKGTLPRGQAAHFICALSLTWPDGHREQFEGRVEGSLTFPPRGKKGFGYDPIFEPEGYGMTFAEMEGDDKHSISHRADAFNQLVSACFPARNNEKSPFIR